MNIISVKNGKTKLTPRIGFIFIFIYNLFRFVFLKKTVAYIIFEVYIFLYMYKNFILRLLTLNYIIFVN